MSICVFMFIVLIIMWITLPVTIESIDKKLSKIIELLERNDG